MSEVEPTKPPMSFPLSEADRDEVERHLQTLSRKDRGDDVPRLVDYLSLTMQPVEERHRALGLSAPMVTAAEEGADDIAAKLPALIQAAKPIAKLLAQQFPSASSHGQQSRGSMALASAIARYGVQAEGSVRLPRAVELSRMISALAALSPSGLPAPDGRPVVKRLSHGIVRAVSVYAQEEGFFSRSWKQDPSRPGKRGGQVARLGNELQPSSSVTNLLVEVARVLRVPEDNSQIRTSFLKYVSELRSPSRRNPNASDLYGSYEARSAPK